MKSKSKTKPIYAPQIEGAGSALTGAYNTAAPKIQDATDQTLSLLPGFIEKARNGDPAINAARGYITDTIGTDTVNPELDGMVAQTSDDVERRLGSRLGRMGLGPAGTTYQARQAEEIAKAQLGLRYGAWNDLQGRKAQAAGMAPGIAAGDAVSVAPALAIGEAAQNPVRAAAGYASGLGGLLGPYTKTTKKGSLGQAIMQAASQAAAAYAGGG